MNMTKLKRKKYGTWTDIRTFSASSCSRDLNGVQEKCPKIVFNPEKDGYSLRNHFDLVCDRAYLGETTNTMFTIGLAVAGASGGLLADKFGRKPLGILSTTLMAIGGKQEILD